MTDIFNKFAGYYSHTDKAQQAAKIRNAARLMISILFNKALIVVGDDDEGLESKPIEGEASPLVLLPRFQNRTVANSLDIAYVMAEETRHWKGHPNYLDFELRAAIEENHRVHVQPFFTTFHRFFKKVAPSNMDIAIENGSLVIVDPAGLHAAAREFLEGFRASEFYDAGEAAMNLNRDLTTYIGFVENGVLDEHERTHTLKSAHLYFARLFRWLAIPEAHESKEFWQQTLEENLEFVDEMTSDWPQVWPCSLTDTPDDAQLLDLLWPVDNFDKDLGAFGTDVTGGYSVYLPRYVIAQYLFSC